MLVVVVLSMLGGGSGVVSGGGVVNGGGVCVGDGRKRRKFLCPNCNKEVKYLPHHMSKVHNWSAASSVAVVGQFNMRKKALTKSRLTIAIKSLKILYLNTLLMSIIFVKVLRSKTSG